MHAKPEVVEAGAMVVAIGVEVWAMGVTNESVPAVEIQDAPSGYECAGSRTWIVSIYLACSMGGTYCRRM